MTLAMFVPNLRQALPVICRPHCCDEGCMSQCVQQTTKGVCCCRLWTALGLHLPARGACLLESTGCVWCRRVPGDRGGSGVERKYTCQLPLDPRWYPTPRQMRAHLFPLSISLQSLLFFHVFVGVDKHAGPCDLDLALGSVVSIHRNPLHSSQHVKPYAPQCLPQSHALGHNRTLHTHTPQCLP